VGAAPECMGGVCRQHLHAICEGAVWGGGSNPISNFDTLLCYALNLRPDLPCHGLALAWALPAQLLLSQTMLVGCRMGSGALLSWWGEVVDGETVFLHCITHKSRPPSSPTRRPVNGQARAVEAQAGRDRPAPAVKGQKWAYVVPVTTGRTRPLPVGELHPTLSRVIVARELRISLVIASQCLLEYVRFSNGHNRPVTAVIDRVGPVVKAFAPIPSSGCMGR